MICIIFDFTVVKRAIISVQNHVLSRFLSTKRRREKKVLIFAFLTIADEKEHAKIHLIHISQKAKKISDMDLYWQI